jgi:hypothetical protein
MLVPLNVGSWMEVIIEHPTWVISLFLCFIQMSNNPKENFDLKHALYKLISAISKNLNLRTVINDSLALLRIRTSMSEHLLTILTAGFIILYGRVTGRNITHGKRKNMEGPEYSAQIIGYHYYEISTLSHAFCNDSQHTENLTG